MSSGGTHQDDNRPTELNYSEVHRLLDRAETAETECATLRANLAAAEALVRELLRELEETRSERDNSNHGYEHTKALKEDIALKLTVAEKTAKERLDRQCRLTDEAITKMQAVAKERDLATDRMVELTKELDDAKVCTANAMGLVSQHLDKIDELAKEMGDLKKHIVSLTLSRENADERIAELKVENKRLQTVTHADSQSRMIRDARDLAEHLQDVVNGQAETIVWLVSRLQRAERELAEKAS